MSPDVKFAEGDSLPILEAVLLGADEQPMDLTGMAIVFRVQRLDQSQPAVDRPVTIDPDQTANKGKVTCKVFDAGTATAGDYKARFKATISGERISFRNDRLLLIHVSGDP
jgi:hypothetical protein